MTYIPLTSLPASIWRNGRYHLVPHLHAVYVNQLRKLNLIELATSDHKNKHIFGGPALQDTTTHFATRFDGSVIRIQNVILDTQSKFAPIPKNIIHTFSSHRVSMLDIPCGTGAGGLAMLSVVHELRRAGVIPCLPLEVRILAGDISIHALDIYQSQINEFREHLSTTGISVALSLHIWDAADLMSTADLCNEWEKTVFEADESFVLVTNFSGAGNPMFNTFKEQLRYISVRVSYKNATLLWIEPGTSGGKTFQEMVSKLIGPLIRRKPADVHEAPFSEAKWWHELKACEFNVQSSVHSYTRIS